MLPLMAMVSLMGDGLGQLMGMVVNGTVHSDG